ncbi:MAG: hypothetical protein H5T84_08780, partial [Thermoleophilia bacterium]|nr:hypothetical protein [Thermoleophilia bacterium]
MRQTLGGELERKVRELVVREGLFPPGTRALLMISGGQDSLALLEILACRRLG